MGRKILRGEVHSFDSHGTGEFSITDFSSIGEKVIFERGVLVFHPKNIRLGSNIYVGHCTILKAYYKNEMVIGNDVWIGQNCFFHSAGGLVIEDGVGIGPGVYILTSVHEAKDKGLPIIATPLQTAPVVIGKNSDIGFGARVLPGVRIGEGTLVGAGAVVTRDTPPYSVVAGVPATVLRLR